MSDQRAHDPSQALAGGPPSDDLRALARRIESQPWHPSQELALALVHAADLALQRASQAAEVTDVRHGLLVFERLFQLRGAKLIEANLLVAQRLRTEWQLGRLLRQARDRGRFGRGNVVRHDITRGEVGLSRDQSSAFQRLAQVDHADLEYWIEEQLNDAELSTTAALVALWSEQRRQQTTAARVETTASLPGTAGVLLAVADAAHLPLQDETVALTVTSPPYGLDVSSNTGPDDPDSWGACLADWLAELWRVTKPGGRLTLIIPLDTTRGGFRQTYAQALWAARQTGWAYRSTIVWAEPHGALSTARGSVHSPAAPHILAPVQMIPLFFKPGPDQGWRRQPPANVQLDLLPDEWAAWTNGLWLASGAHQGWVGDPSPLERAHRLIKLLSFPGDLVLDPFLGSGTTALAARTLGRRVLGFDRSLDAMASA